MSEECQHVWISNSGQGGEPRFKLNRQLNPKPLMHVKCERCNSRTWFTQEQWNEILVHPSEQGGGNNE